VREKPVFILLLAIALLAIVPSTLLAQSVFRVAMQPIVQVDPALISSDAEVAVASAVYDYLVDVDAGSRIIPRLAASWEVSDDGTEYTFTLADGVRYHDGSPLVPGDVVWTFDRLRDPANGFATESVYANVERIDVTGAHEVTFRLAQPNPFFLYDLSDNHALVLKRGTTDFAEFNGTGAFVVDDYRPEDRIVMTANPDYFLDGQPGLDGLQFIFFGDQVAAVDALRGGQVDMAWRMSSALFLTL